MCASVNGKVNRLAIMGTVSLRLVTQFRVIYDAYYGVVLYSRWNNARLSQTYVHLTIQVARNHLIVKRVKYYNYALQL